MQASADELGQIAIRADVSSEADVVVCFAQIHERYGYLDVLVANAGVIDATATPAVDINLDECRRLLAINLEGCFLTAREAARLMIGRGGGSIVTLASVAGLIAVPNRTAYSMSKAAIVGLTRSLACEWASDGIRVNAVLPGYVATDIVEALVANAKVDLSVVERRIPLGRLARPAEIAAAIHHLASPDAGFTTGASLAVDGGYGVFGGTGPASTGGVPARTNGGPRVGFVTGAASGIGAAVSRRLAADGHRLLLFDRDANALALVATALGAGHRTFVGDVTSEDDVRKAAALASADLGPATMLVNNVGVADAFEPTLDQSLDRFRRGVDVNLTSALIVAKTLATGMIAAGRGAIVNLASIGGLLGLPRRNAYCAAKSGIVMLTKSLACEWAAHGIRVNAVAPGYIATPGVTALEQSGKRDLAIVRRRTPLGRLGAADEIAAAVAFLLSNDASYISGTTYSVDGGWSAFGDAGDAS